MGKSSTLKMLSMSPNAMHNKYINIVGFICILQICPQIESFSHSRPYTTTGSVSGCPVNQLSHSFTHYFTLARSLSLSFLTLSLSPYSVMSSPLVSVSMRYTRLANARDSVFLPGSCSCHVTGTDLPQDCWISLPSQWCVCVCVSQISRVKTAFDRCVPELCFALATSGC